MKKNHLLSMSCMTAMLLISATVSAGSEPKPAACPAASAIVSAGISMVDRDDQDNTFVVGTVNSYGTSTTWGFGIVLPYADAATPDIALGVARAVLPTLSGNPSPVFDQEPDGSAWVCIYSINKYVAAAMTMPSSLANVAHTPSIKAVL